MRLLGYCDACHNVKATHHLTVQVTVFGPRTIRDKLIQINLCDACEISSRKMLAVNHQATFARALTSFHLFDNQFSLPP